MAIKKISFLLVFIVFSLLLGACGSKNGGTSSGGRNTSSGTILKPEEMASPVKEYWQTTIKAVEFWSVTPKKLSTEISETAPFLVDVRYASEIEGSGYIAGAVNIPVRQLLDKLDRLPGPDAPIVLYDGTGHRGALGTMALRMIGYSNVRNLVRGVGGWKNAGFSLVTGGLPAEPIQLSTGIIPDEAVFPSVDNFMDNLPEGAYTIQPSDLAVELTGSTPPFLVDVRLEYEWDVQRIGGATRIDFSALLGSLDQLPIDKNAPIVIYCTDGHRSAMAMMALSLIGYTNVRSLAGGIYAWKAAGLPVE